MTDIGTKLKNCHDPGILSRDIIEHLREPIVFLDAELRVVLANPAFYETFSLTESRVRDAVIYDIDNGGWDIPALREAIDTVTAGGMQAQDIEIEHFFSGAGQKIVRINARRPTGETGDANGILLVIQDLTEVVMTRRAMADARAQQQALADSVNRFRTVLENSRDAAYRRDLDTDAYDYMSPVIEQITGFTAGQFAEMPMEEVIERIHPDERTLLQSRLETVMSAPCASDLIEYRFQCKNGKYRWLSDSLKVVCDGQGRPRYRVGILRDVTERKLMEENLRVSWDTAEKRAQEAEDSGRILEAILVSIPEGITVVEPPDARLKLVSRFYEEFTGISAEELFEMSLENRLQALPGIRWYQDMPASRENSPEYRALIKGETIMDEEWKLQRPDNSQAVLSVIAAPVYDNDGHIAHAVISWRDITEKKQMEAALRRNEHEFRTLVESSPDIILRIDRDMRYVFVNATYERITGISREQFIGRSNRELGMPKKLSEQWRQAVKKAIASGREVKIEFSFSGLFGKRFFWGNIIPEYSGSGMVESLMMVARDITERKQAEDHIRYMSFHDELTGLYNRAYFEEEVRRLDNERALPLSFIMGDVNNLKLVNDAFGHTEGDQLLRSVAQILKKSCRNSDVIARWGGDEFAIILPNTDLSTTEKICSRIKAAAEKHNHAVIAPSIALGAAAKDTAKQAAHQVIVVAEERMYDNKLAENRQNQKRVIASLQNRIAQKTPDMKHHITRSRKLAAAFASTLGLTESQMHEMNLLIDLHDIGKAVLPTQLLQKQAPLRPDEWETLKRHPEAGFRIANTFADTAKISEDILSIRERWDGSGYPRGLRGKDIPFLARLFMIIDAYDVMTHHRAYERVLSPEEAVAELRRRAGTHFDPELVAPFIEAVAA
ncbi:MAG: sensor domain-containing diguanylate cyclase/phosphohydrolase [Thermodesulfobacteriota bacterium]